MPRGIPAKDPTSLSHVTVVVSTSARVRLAEAKRFLSDLPPLTEAILASATREAADDFARDLTLSRGALFGLHRFSFWQLAGRVAALELARKGFAPTTSLGSEALAARATFDALSARRLEYFDPVARCHGFAGTLARTLADLRLAEVDPAMLPHEKPGTRDLGCLVARYEALLGSGKIADRAALLRYAISAAREGGSDFSVTRPVLLLDVPIGSVVEAQFVEALAYAAPRLLATVPGGDRRTLAWLEAMTGAEIVEPADLEKAGARERPKKVEKKTERGNDLVRLRERLFRFEEREAGEPGAATAELRSVSKEESRVIFFSAPGEGRECVEVVRAILAEAGRGVRFDQMAVVLRVPHLYSGLLETALHRGGVPPGSRAVPAFQTRPAGPSSRSCSAEARISPPAALPSTCHLGRFRIWMLPVRRARLAFPG